jgi:hypothetical protein
LCASSQIHGVAAGGDILYSLGEDGTGEDGSGCGAVTGNLVGLGGDILEEAGPEVLEFVFEGDGSRNGDTICRELVNAAAYDIHIVHHLL